MSCCVAACFQFNRNITESRRRQFTSSYSKNPLRINVWWLALKLTASRSTSTVFCPKIFWSVIRNAFRDCVSNWKCWNSARAKNGSEDPATHGPYMERHHMLPTANHQKLLWMREMQLVSGGWFNRGSQHPKPTRNVLWWMAWAKKCSALWIKSVEIRTRRVSRVLASAFYIGARFKNSPGRQACTWIGQQWIFVKYIIAGIRPLCQRQQL